MEKASYHLKKGQLVEAPNAFSFGGEGRQLGQKPKS